MRYVEARITASQAGLMVKQVLAVLCFSRRLRRALTESAGIRLNGQPVYWTTRVAIGDLLTVDAPPEERSSTVIPEDIPLSVAYEDEHVLVVDKAAGMVAHPTGTHVLGTLVSAVAHHVEAHGEHVRCRPLHRLDRETSGLVLFAKHKLAHERLVAALLARRITREYTAFVHGLLSFDERVLDMPIARLSEQSLQRAVTPDGKRAITHVRVLKRYKTAQVTRVQIRLETGRTHQIRVHMAHIGHPLLGDWLYGLSPDPLMARQALHAGRLHFVHPLDGRTIDIRADLPSDLQSLDARLEPL